LNPGSPAPQASVLIRSSHAYIETFNVHAETPHADTITRPRAQVKHIDKIINTLLWLKRRGRAESTIHTNSLKLKQLARHTDLMNVDQVLMWIAENKTLCNLTKNKLVDCYKNFASANGFTFDKPKYKYERKIPLIPTTENIYKVISASSWKYSVMFMILEQTGIETRELATTRRQDIDARKRNNKRNRMQRTQLKNSETYRRSRTPCYDNGQRRRFWKKHNLYNKSFWIPN
jgi:hypothetical protein